MQILLRFNLNTREYLRYLELYINDTCSSAAFRSSVLVYEVHQDADKGIYVQNYDPNAVMRYVL